MTSSLSSWSPTSCAPLGRKPSPHSISSQSGQSDEYALQDAFPKYLLVELMYALFTLNFKLDTIASYIESYTFTPIAYKFLRHLWIWNLESHNGKKWMQKMQKFSSRYRGRGENVMALLGSITFFEKRYCVMEVHNAFSKTLFCYWKFQRYASWTVFQSVIALWRSITLLQKRYCVMGSF